MRRVIASALLGTVSLVSFLSPTSAPVQAAETYTRESLTRESLDQTFRLEWSKTARNVNGYVYNSSSRHAAYMRLLVEGVDGSGNVVNKTTTWVVNVPPNNRAFFDVSVPDAPSYRVSILSFNWIQEIASNRDHRKAS